MDLNYFKGKVCSILTTPIQRKLSNKEEEIQYFVGVIEEITKEGVFMTQIATGLKGYFNINNIIGIFEEEVLEPPVLDENGVVEKTSEITNENIDIDSMTKLLNAFKNNEK
jgi:hypothetical protein